jgi:hypothetical protein
LARAVGHRRCFCDGCFARVLRKKELARKLIEVTKAFSLWKAQTSPPAYSFGVDAFTQQRILYLKDEIASLRHDNELYRLRGNSTRLQTMANESRRSRLKEIKEELLMMGLPPRNKS